MVVRLDARIAGVGMTRFMKYPDKGLKELGTEAVQKAVADAGLGLDDIEAAYVGNCAAGLVTGQESVRGQVILDTIGVGKIPIVNVENACHYCVPAHTGIAKNMGVDDAITEALRNNTLLPNARLEALRDFTLSVVRDRGNVDESKVQAFLDAGFSKRNILEVILGYSQKVMSNYTNHLADTPVDKPFQKFTWQQAA